NQSKRLVAVADAVAKRGLSDLYRRRSESQIAADRNRNSAAITISANSSDSGLPAVVQRHHAFPADLGVVLLSVLAHAFFFVLGNVGAGDEGLVAGTANNDHFHLGIRFQLLDTGAHAFPHV